jgi:hypothetical protein
MWGGDALLRIRIRMDLHDFGLLDPGTKKLVPKFEFTNTIINII